MPHRDLVTELPPKEPVFRWRDIAVVVLTVGMIGMIWYVEHTVIQLNNDSKVRGYKNRAAVCDFVKEFAGNLPRTCHDPALTPYLDPTIVPGAGERQNTTRLLCLVLKKVAPEVKDPQCAPIVP